MGSRAAKRRRKGAPKGATEATQSQNNDSASCTLKALLSAINSPQGMTKAVLKRLYFLLNHLCQNQQCRSSNGLKSSILSVEISKVRTEDIKRLSDVLFKELSQRFDQFFSALPNLSNNDAGDGNSASVMAEAAEIVNWLLRCCLVLLILLQDQQSLLLEKAHVLLQVRRSLCSLNLNVKNERRGFRFEKSVSRACEYGENDCTTSTEDFMASLHFLEPSDSRLPLLSAMLEVILDEVLVHEQLGPLFEIIDRFATATGMLHMSHSGQGDNDNGPLIEIICTHFSIAFLEKNAVEDFLDRLFWTYTERFSCSSRPKELSTSAAIMLLLNPILLFAPKVMQAHILALVSEATVNVVDFKDWKPNFMVINCSLTVFEKSVALYIKYISSSRFYSNLASSKGSEKSNVDMNTIQQSFESFVFPNMTEKINHLITKSDGFPESHFGNMSCKMKSDLVSCSIKYVKECQHVFDMSCQDEILSILSCIILRASDGFCDPIGVGDLEDFCVLSSILKLMSNALLQVIGCLRHCGDSNCTKSLKDFSSSKEYEYISSIISCFTEFSIHLPIQQILCKLMETKCTWHSSSKMMFLHFSGLLSLAFSTGLDFLVKGCLLTIMSLMNLFAFEEGILDVLYSALCSSSESFQSDLQQVNIQEAVLNQSSSLVVASKFQKIRTLYSSTPSPANHLTGSGDGYCDTGRNGLVLGTMEGDVGTEEETEESRNGELYLRCVIKNSQMVSDFDELADFIECKNGKDYSSWLKDREQYRKWKGEKMAVLRWKRKKKTWRVMKSKRI
ncbi:uncharacterized protein LOC113750003 isoform X1 [Coffea eugenioides]|uniref:uncharacterized protein LOC113750003 isoform X1 n=1 Tax=Coffea eugenioides TaxID=49369 RepID=UPI000F60BB04|nr:uncharacterized protein LOC113750003 isoform X1 [Coffea eugenioides]